jgi:transposase
MDDRLPPPEGIPAAEWATWPLAARVLIMALQQQVAALTARMHELEQRLNQTSQNSSKPPSSDPPSAPPRPQKPHVADRAAGSPGMRAAPASGVSPIPSCRSIRRHAPAARRRWPRPCRMPPRRA